MSGSARAWIAAATVGAVEVLKDQGICRWNYVIKSMNQHAKNRFRSYAQAKQISSRSSALFSTKFREEKAKQSEESLRKVMYLSCWGPN